MLRAPPEFVLEVLKFVYEKDEENKDSKFENKKSHEMIDAIKKGELQTLIPLLENKDDVNHFIIHKKKPLFFERALRLAEEEGYFSTFQHMLKFKPQAHALSGPSMAPLHLAVKTGHLDITQHLLKSKAHVNALTDDGTTPLHFAVKEGHLAITQHLLKSKAHVNALTDDDITPLYFAAKKGSLDITQLLVESKAVIDAPSNDDEKATPLYLAAEQGHFTVVKYLMKSKADPSLALTNGTTPAMISIFNKHYQIAKFMLQETAKAGEGRLLENDVTLLHLAAQFGQVKIMELLLKHKAEINAKTKKLSTQSQQTDVSCYNSTPLYVATEAGQFNSVKYLIENKANVNEPINTGETPLIMSSWNNHPKIAEILLDAKANPENLTKTGLSALHAAAQSGSPGIIKLLLKRKVSIETKRSDGASALCIAAAHNKLPVVEVLLENQANVNFSITEDKACAGRTPLQLAIIRKHTDVVKKLLEADASLEDEAKDGFGSLNLARLFYYQPIIDLLTETLRLKSLEHKISVLSESSLPWDLLIHKYRIPKKEETFQAKPVSSNSSGMFHHKHTQEAILKELEKHTVGFIKPISRL